MDIPSVLSSALEVGIELPSVFSLKLDPEIMSRLPFLGCNLLEEGYNQGYNFPSEVTTGKDLISAKGYNLSSDISLARKEVEALLGVSQQALQKAIKRGNYQTILVDGPGGKQYRIALSSLPVPAQIKWIEAHAQEAMGLPAVIKDKLAPQVQWEIAKMNARVEAAGMNTLIEGYDQSRLDLVLKALSIPNDWKKGKWIDKCAEDSGLTRQTLYRDIKGYKEQGAAWFKQGREKKGPTAWDAEALEYMNGIYLKAIRESGDSSKRFAYHATIAEAKKRNWKVGSESSAYDYLGKLNPMLERYARGGSRALDNVFYILRQYHDLDPFECIVGDQHRFDFWVHDREFDRVFRMEGFFWVDLRSRMPYGFAITDRYNSYLIGLALRMGLKRFGKFTGVYTDNGKPEISKYTHSILNDLRAYGMQQHDVSELYRSENGYVIESDEGEVIEVVPTPQAWHKHARPYNAKAKLIERFFRTLESILSKDLNVPGLVKNLRGTIEDADLSDKRIAKLHAENKLLTPEEFTLKVFEAMDLYIHRRHSALKKSPMDELFGAVKNGFTPRTVVESELDFVLMARDERSVNRGRIQINNTLYEGISLEHGLWDVQDSTRVQVRYDLYADDAAIAIRPDGAAVQLRRVPESSMKAPALTGELMEWKKGMINKIKDQYRKLTAPIPGIVEYSAHTKAALNLKKAVKAAEPKLTDSEYRAEAERIIADSTQPVRRPMMARKPFFGAEHEHYKWCVDTQLGGYELPEQDIKFMGVYEARMEEPERIQYEEYRRFYKSEAAENERR